ncbi:MAG TPA: Hsp20/alpha crystallin family protein [Caulobacteraceae bacterium]|nr:Hsp20/alpha crystallin family protein [Caulobacteraceae bacterium]
MAEPQTNQDTEHARTKGGAGSNAETRSFDEPRSQRLQGEGRPPTSRAVSDARAMEADTSRSLAEMRRSALDPLLAMQYDVTRWFDDLWRQTFGFRHSSALPFGALRGFGAAGLFGLPPTDVRETTDAHVLAIELPGLTRQDVDISIDGDSLVVSGHKAEENDGGGSTYRISERRFGRFERAFPLPPDVDRGKIEARFQDGVLKITLPKDPAAGPSRSRIEIKG